MGFNKREINEIQDLRKEKAQGGDVTLFRQLFKREIHTTLVNNLNRCGILSDSMRGKLEVELRVNVAEHLEAD